MKDYYVYILASQRNGTLYVGVTNNLARRIWEHKNRINISFTSRYSINRLVYYEVHQDIFQAIHREKLIKKWRRKWKLDLIEKDNPGWEDLARDW